MHNRFDRFTQYPPILRATASILALLITAHIAIAAPEPVQWTELVNTAADGSTLTKTGVSGWNGGAWSVHGIQSGDGYLEATLPTTSYSLIFGLGKDNSSTSYTDVEFAIYAGGATLRVYESGTYRGAFGAYAAGDVVRIEVAGTSVLYKRNGTTIFTSPVTLSSTNYPLHADTTLNSTNASIENCVMEGVSAPPTDNTPPEVESLLPADTGNLTSTGIIDVTFSESVSGVSVDDLTISGTAAGTATVHSATQINGNTWRFAIINLFQSGQLSLILDGDIQDLQGNDLTPANWNYTVDIGPIISMFPYTESFETGIGNWTQSLKDMMNWTQSSGTTTSSGTGPNAAPEGSYYLYTEASSPNYPSKTAEITALFDFSSITNPQLSFQYHMYGASMGALHLDIFNGSSWVNSAWTQSGQAQSSNAEAWNTAVVDLSAYGGTPIIAIRFRGITGTSYTSDMCIDNFNIFPAASITPTVVGLSPADEASLNPPGHIDITLSAPVTNMSADDLVVSGPASGSVLVGAPTNIGGNTWRFSLSGLYAPGQLSLLLDGDIEDLLGNELTPASWTYTVVPETVPPTIIATTPTDGSSIDGGAPVNFSFTFSEAVTSVYASALSLSGSSVTNATVGAPTAIGNTWTFSVSDLGPGTLSMTLDGTIADHSGNDLLPATRDYTVTQRAIFFSEPLDTQPAGWTMEGQWQFGPPLGLGAFSGGSPDPTTGATGTNVLGVNLGGDYATTVSAANYLTTAAINCAGRTNVELRFQRWLNTDYPNYAHAMLEVSNDGASWTEFFHNSSGTAIWDASWTDMVYDISAIADNQSTVYIRWGYYVGSSGAYSNSGWNIDDIQLIAEFDGNHAPVISGSSEFWIIENTVNGTTIGTVTATDPDAGDTITYAISGGTGATAFSIDANDGSIIISDASQLDYETAPSSQFTLNVTANDQNGLGTARTLTLHLTDEPEAPIFPDQTFSVNDSSINGTAVGTVFATDPEGIETVTFTLVGGTGENILSLAPNGLISVSDATQLDRAAAPVLTLIVDATEPSGMSTTRVLTIVVTQILPQLTDLTLSKNELPNAIDTTGGYDVGSLSTFNPGSPNLAYSYSITGGVDSGSFSIANEQLIIDAGILDASVKPLFNIEITATDENSETLVKIFAISVNDQIPVIHGPTMLTVPKAGSISFSIDVSHSNYFYQTSAVSEPQNGTLTGGGLDWTYIPNTPFTGQEAVTLHLSAGRWELAPIVITFNVVDDGTIDQGTLQPYTGSETVIHSSLWPGYTLELMLGDDGNVRMYFAKCGSAKVLKYELGALYQNDPGTIALYRHETSGTLDLAYVSDSNGTPEIRATRFDFTGNMVLMRSTAGEDHPGYLVLNESPLAGKTHLFATNGFVGWAGSGGFSGWAGNLDTGKISGGDTFTRHLPTLSDDARIISDPDSTSFRIVWRDVASPIQPKYRLFATNGTYLSEPKVADYFPRARVTDVSGRHMEWRDYGTRTFLYRFNDDGNRNAQPLPIIDPAAGAEGWWTLPDGRKVRWLPKVSIALDCVTKIATGSWQSGSTRASANYNFAIDADTDGMDDQWEFDNSVTAPSLDHDADGLTNLQEFRNGSDPFNPDSDDDLLSDQLEYNMSNHPNTNLRAFYALENSSSFGPTPDSLRDFDGDGWPNITELNLASDPLDPSSNPYSGLYPPYGRILLPSDIVQYQFCIGDDSGSHTEVYRLKVEGAGQTYLIDTPVSNGETSVRCFTMHLLSGQTYQGAIIPTGEDIGGEDSDGDLATGYRIIQGQEPTITLDTNDWFKLPNGPQPYDNTYLNFGSQYDFEFVTPASGGTDVAVGPLFPRVACVGDSLLLTTTASPSGGTYTWTPLADPSTGAIAPGDQSLPQPQMTFAVPGTYTYQVTYSAAGETAYATAGDVIVPDVDLDIDSDNTNGFTLPDRSQIEDANEDSIAKITPMAKPIPLIFTVPNGITDQISFNGANFKLWNQNLNLDDALISNGGNQIAVGTNYSIADGFTILNQSSDSITFVVYAEGTNIGTNTIAATWTGFLSPIGTVSCSDSVLVDFTPPDTQNPSAGLVDTNRNSDCVCNESQAHLAQSSQNQPLSDPAYEQIYVDRGEEAYTQTDMIIAGRGLNWEHTRTYRSRSLADSPMGIAWTHNNLDYIYDNGGGSLRGVHGAGPGDTDRFDDWDNPVNGRYERPDGIFGRLTRVENAAGLEDDELTLIDRDGTKRIYKFSGAAAYFVGMYHLHTIIDRFDNQMDYRYEDTRHPHLLTSVIDSLGRKIDYEYYSWTDDIEARRNRLKLIRDFTGRELSYDYDAYGNLIEARSPIVEGTVTGNDFLHGQVETYAYFTDAATPALQHNLKHVIRPNENDPTHGMAPDATPALSWTYYSDPNDSETYDRVQTHTIGNTSAGYASAGGALTYWYDAAPVTPADFDPTRESAAVFKTTERDRNGNYRVYWIGSSTGIVRKEIYSPTAHNETGPIGSPTSVYRYLVNKDNQNIRKENPEGDYWEIDYDHANWDPHQHGNILSSTYYPIPNRHADQASLTWTYIYDPIYNQPCLVIDPRGNDADFVPPNGGASSAMRYAEIYTFDYQEEQNTPAHRAAIGAKVGLGSNEVEFIIANNEDQIEALLGMPVALLGQGDVNNDGITSRAQGMRLKRQRPTVTLRDGSNQTVEELWSYDANGQLLSHTDPKGNVSQMQYHPAADPNGDGITSEVETTRPGNGYLWKSIRDPLGLAVTTSFDRDPVGNGIGVTDARGNYSQTVYNALNQVIRTVSPAPYAYRTDIFYDANGNIVETRQENRAPQLDVDRRAQFSNDNVVDMPVPGLTWIVDLFDYDILNNKVLSDRDARGSDPDHLLTTYYYDANENLEEIVDPKGHSTFTSYEERDLPKTITVGNGSPIAATNTNIYDANGNLTARHDAQDTDGVGGVEISEIEYDGFNRAWRSVSSVGTVRESIFDPASNVIDVKVYGTVGGISPTDSSGSTNALLSHVKTDHDELSRAYFTHNIVKLTYTAEDDNNTDGSLSPGDDFVSNAILYDPNGLIQEVTEDDGDTATTTYDALNRIHVVIDQAGNSIQNVYDPNSNVIQIIRFDVSQDQTAVASSTTSATNIYDVLNRRIKTSDDLNNETWFAYDSRHNLTITTDGEGNTSELVYDAAGRRIASHRAMRIDGSGAQAIDPSQSEDGFISTFTVYDANSLVHMLIDDNGNVTTYIYDERNRRTSTMYGDNASNPTPVTSESWIYDLEGNVTIYTDQNGSVHTSLYDAANRTRSIAVVPAGDLIGTTKQTFEYDGLNRTTRTVDENNPGANDDVSVASVYDPLSRPLCVTTTIGNLAPKSVRYAYNGSAANAGATAATSTFHTDNREIGLTYDANNRIQSIYDAEAGPANPIAHYSYAGGGNRLAKTTFQNGATIIPTYDAIRRTTAAATRSASNATIVSFGIGYDKAHNKLGERKFHDQYNSNRYYYDSAYRLQEFKRGYFVNYTTEPIPTNTSGVTRSRLWALDGIGNWQGVETNIDGTISTETRLHTNFNEIESVSVDGDPVTSFTNDDSGNQTLSPPIGSAASRTYKWDAFNRLREVYDEATGNQLAAYLYDTANRRVRKQVYAAGALAETTTYYYNGWRVCDEYTLVNLTQTLKTQYVWGALYHDELVVRDHRDGITVAQLNDHTGQERQFQHGDSQFSIHAVTDESGAVLERYIYDPHGNQTIQSASFGVLATSVIGQEFGFTGQRADLETGLLYFKNRYYDPDQGRFVSRDPLGYVDGMGMYNNYFAVNGVDTFGLNETAGSWRKYTAGTKANSPVFGKSAEDRASWRARMVATDAATREVAYGGRDAFGMLLGIVCEPADWAMIMNDISKNGLSKGHMLAMLPLISHGGIKSAEIVAEHKRLKEIDLTKGKCGRSIGGINARTWQEYERGIQELHGTKTFKQRQYQAIVDGEIVDGVADNVAVVSGKSIAVEAKFVTARWESSIRNPQSSVGGKPFSKLERWKMIKQAKKYSAAFDEVIYHTNDRQFMEHYQTVFRRFGISNVKFIHTP